MQEKQLKAAVEATILIVETTGSVVDKIGGSFNLFSNPSDDDCAILDCRSFNDDELEPLQEFTDYDVSGWYGNFVYFYY